MKEHWIREGFSNYYTAKKQADITYEKRILLQHSLECLLPCEFRMEDDEEYYYFETGLYFPLMEKIDQIDPAAFFYEFFCALEEMESYLLNLDYLKIEEDLVFLRDEKYPVFCYLPEEERNIYEQIRNFLEICMEKISYDDRKKAGFYYELHSYLTRERPNIRQIKNYLKPEPKPEKEESLPEPDFRQEETEEAPAALDKGKTRNLIRGILLILGSFFCIGLTSFFIVKLFVYGLYYKFVLGFLISAMCFGADVVCLVRYFREKHLPEDEKENLPEYTQLLAEDDQKTVLLMEAPMGYLIRYPPGQEEEIRLSGEEFIIGSLETGMDYRLPAVGVSRKHVRFTLENGEVWAEDLNSTNGTKVNGKKIKKQKLKDGDKIQIAREEFEFTEKMV